MPQDENKPNKDSKPDTIVGMPKAWGGAPLAGSREYACSKCFQMVVIARSGQRKIERDRLKVICLDCVDWDQVTEPMQMPTREELLDDMGIINNN
ncbi:hypothetical protein F183_A36410 [Bryobacterales bacterium F-183]|nr:hypothetical protein F183_A36410 [Bryobacterales bacterium F-183]